MEVGTSRAEGHIHMGVGIWPRRAGDRPGPSLSQGSATLRMISTSLMVSMAPRCHGPALQCYHGTGQESLCALVWGWEMAEHHPAQPHVDKGRPCLAPVWVQLGLAVSVLA